MATIEEAQIVWDNRSNGSISGISASKGGRVWIDGEFRLCELEALCILIRREAGEKAEGLEELLSIWDAENA